MKVTQNGKYVRIEKETDWEEMPYLMCVCRHYLKDHQYENTFGSRVMFETSGCTHCNCAQFKVSGKVQTTGYVYA